jgi:hypothetical protein
MNVTFLAAGVVWLIIAMIVRAKTRKGSSRSSS